MLNIDFTFLWTAINLFLLYLIVKKFLFGRLAKYMENRSNSIAADLQNAEKMREELSAQKQKYEEQLSKTEELCRNMVEEARLKAEKDSDTILKKAKKEAASIVFRARQEAKRQEDVIIGDVNNRVAVLALKAASKVIQVNMDNSKNRELIDEFIKDEGVA